MSPKRLDEPDPLTSLGGKSQIIEKICKIAEFAIDEYDLVGAADYFMGGCRLFLHLDPDSELEFKLANEIDRGVINFFLCLQDIDETEELVEKILTLADDYITMKGFTEANELRLKDETDKVLSGALTYIVSKYSRAADRHTYCETNTIKGINSNTLKKLYNLDRTIGDVEITCGDYKDQFHKYTHRRDIISWFDPPYIVTKEYKSSKKTLKVDVNTTKTTEKTSGYHHKFINEDHELLVDNLLATENKVILCGYENEIYERLINNGFYKYCLGLVNVPSSGKSEKKRELIWTNFEVPDRFFPRDTFDLD